MQLCFQQSSTQASIIWILEVGLTEFGFIKSFYLFLIGFYSLHHCLNIYIILVLTTAASLLSLPGFKSCYTFFVTSMQILTCVSASTHVQHWHRWVRRIWGPLVPCSCSPGISPTFMLPSWYETRRKNSWLTCCCLVYYCTRVDSLDKWEFGKWIPL